MTILSATLTLFLVMDPIGGVPVFAALLKGVDNRRWSRVVLRENLIALVTMVFFLFFGPKIMGMLHIKEPALNVAGGLVLIIVALEMIFPGRGRSLTSSESESEPFIVPLAIPLIAGPSTLAVLMLMATQYPRQRMEWLLALLAAWAAGLTILLLAGRLHHLLGQRGLAAAERLMGMILIVVAVQMTMTGVGAFLHG